MSFDINVLAGVVAGLFAVVPGAIIHAPAVYGKRWAKAVGVNEKDMQGPKAQTAMVYMLITSIISGLLASTFVQTMSPSNMLGSVQICLLLGWFAATTSLMAVFFEKRSWEWFWISALNHICSFLVIGIILGLFL